MGRFPPTELKSTGDGARQLELTHIREKETEIFAFTQKPWLWPPITMKSAGPWHVILSGTSFSFSTVSPKTSRHWKCILAVFLPPFFPVLSPNREVIGTCLCILTSLTPQTISKHHWGPAAWSVKRSDISLPPCTGSEDGRERNSDPVHTLTTQGILF